MVAIIAILITLLVLGVNSVVRSSREKSTRVQMENLKNLIVERTTTGGMQAIYSLYNPVLPPTTPSYPNGSPLPQPSRAPGNSPIAIPLDMKPVGADRTPTFATQSPPDPSNELGRTALVMTLLRSVPANAKMLAGLPSNSFLTPVPTTLPPGVSAQLPVDGWGNPMIFVPGGGITVFVTGSNGTPQPILKTSPDGKGFWVSGGPDGFIGGYFDKDNSGTPTAGDTPYGDDNVYSFEN